jgi:hypothetical protein
VYRNKDVKREKRAPQRERERERERERPGEEDVVVENADENDARKKHPRAPASRVPLSFAPLSRDHDRSRRR